MLGDCILAMLDPEQSEEGEQDRRAAAFVLAEIALIYRQSMTQR